MNYNPINTVWSAAYCTDAAPLTSTTKQARVMRALRGYRGDSPLIHEITPNQRAYKDAGFEDQQIWSDIATVHDPKYVNAVRTGVPRDLAESQWFTWSPAFAQSVMHIWAGHRVACRFALHTRSMVLHPVSGAHHAGYAHGAGFCTFNYIVGAGRYLLRQFPTVSRIGVIDLDVHFGDGTTALTVGDDRFVHFDVSGGAKTEKSNATTFRAFHHAWSARDYLKTVKLVSTWLDTVRPSLVIYQAGADPLAEDSLGGIAGVTLQVLYDRDLIVLGALHDRRIPTVVTFAGGYVPDKTEQAHINTVRAMWTVSNGLTSSVALPASTIWRDAQRASVQEVP